MTRRPGWVVAHPRAYHGLGNRVRSVLGTRALARVEDREFAYAWRTGPKFGARFDELWSIDDRTLPWPVSSALSVRYPFRDHRAGTWVPQARGERLWQVRTAHALELPDGSPDWTEDLRSLRPAEEVLSLVDALHRRHLAGAPYIGVMLRSHPLSHAETLQASPVEWFVDRMLALRQQLPDVRFFVSADTAEGLARLRAAVPGCVGLEAKGAYNSRRALQCSVADLYLLAASMHVLGPHYSSFPELAQHLAGPQLRLETSRTGPEELWGGGPVSHAPDPVRPHEREAATL